MEACKTAMSWSRPEYLCDASSRSHGGVLLIRGSYLCEYGVPTQVAILGCMAYAVVPSAWLLGAGCVCLAVCLLLEQ